MPVNFLSKKRKNNRVPSRELVFIVIIIIIVVLLECFTSWDEQLISNLYNNNVHPLSDIAINAMLAGLFFSVYAGWRFVEYKRVLAKKIEIEQTLQESQRQLDIILSNSSTIVYTIEPTPDLSNTYISNNVKSILGYEPQQFFGGNFWFKIIHPADGRIILENVQQFFETGSADHDLRVKHADGSWRWVYNRIKLLKDENGQPLEIVGSWMDITDKKLTERALRKSEERFQLAANAAQDVIYDWDIVADTWWTNEQFAAFGGSDAWDLNRFLNKIHPDDQLLTSESIQDTLYKKLGHWSRKFRLMKMDGSYAYVLSKACIVYSKSGEPIRWIGIMSDITSIKEAEQKVRDAKEKAEESTRAKSEFLANMSHEIRTPLNGIIGMTELTLETRLTQQQQRYLSIVKSSSETLMEIISDILDFSKIDAGKLQLSPVPFSLREQVAKSLQILALKAEEKGLEFIFRLDPDVPDQLIGDILRLQQILMNLAGNAIKFTQQGEVILDVRLDSITGKDAVLIFTISDTGIGIAEGKLDLIFDEFTQVDNSTSRKYGGTGLGLAITKRLVDLMEGTIIAESTVGTGSKFQFTVKVGLQKKQLLRTLPARPCLQDKRVMVVQGNQLAAAYSSELLKQFGTKVKVFHSGEAVVYELKLAIEEQEPYGFILLDTKLQGEIDGFMLAEHIKEDQQLANIPVIVVSMSQRASDREWFAQLGIIYFISKPFSPSDLLDNISLLLAEKNCAEKAGEFLRDLPEDEKGATLSVLLTEDNVVNQEVAQSMLERLGHKVSIASNGIEALAAIKMNHFDLVLMDVQMPLMNGYEATRRIRQMEQLTGRRIPIIGLTANVMSGDKELCLEAGMDDYIAKPMRLTDLNLALLKFEK